MWIDLGGFNISHFQNHFLLKSLIIHSSNLNRFNSVLSFPMSMVVTHKNSIFLRIKQCYKNLQNSYYTDNNNLHDF